MPYSQEVGGPVEAHSSATEAEDRCLPSAPDNDKSGPDEDGCALSARVRTSTVIDYSDWTLNRSIFLRLQQQYGPFDLDGACDDQGENAHTWDFCSPSRSFLETDFAGKNIYLNAPFDQIEAFLAHYLRTKIRDSSTRGVFVVPKWKKQPWFRLLKNFTLIEEIPAGSAVFTHPSRQPEPRPGDRVSEGPTRWPVQIYVDKSARVRFLP